MVYGISAKSSVEVRAAAAAFRLAPKEIKRAVTTGTKEAFKDDWQRAVRTAASRGPGGPQRAQMLRNAGSVNIIGTQPLKLAAYKSGRLKGGLTSKDEYYAYEFGDAHKDHVRYASHSRSGRRYVMVRRTQEQLPPRVKEGYSVYPVVSGFIPRIVSFWVQSIVRSYYDAFAAKGV